MPSLLLPAAGPAPSNRPGTDCRVFERLSCELPTTCQPASALEMKEMRWNATISDISLGGVRLLLPRRFEKNTGLAIELPGNEERDSTVVFVKVVHVRSQGNGTWALGCRFLSELSEDQLESMLTSANHVLSSSKPQADEKKHLDKIEHEAPRGAVPEAHLFANVHLAIETRPGSIVHCTIKRLNAAKCWPLRPGKILSLNGSTPDRTPWAMRIQITQWSRLKTGWELKGRLVDSPAAADLLHARRR